MRIKRFEVVPFDFEIETNAPLLVKLRFYGTFWRFIRLFKIQPVMLIAPHVDKEPIGRPFWRLYYARVKWVRV